MTVEQVSDDDHRNQGLIVKGKEVSERTPSGDLKIIGHKEAEEFNDRIYTWRIKPDWLRPRIVENPSEVSPAELPHDRGW